MKYLSIIKYILLVTSFIIVAVGAFTYTDMSDGGVNAMLTWAYIMFFLSVALAVIAPLIGIVQNPKSAVKSLLGLGIMVVVILISYAMSSDTPVTLAGGTEIYDNVGGLKFSDTALYTTYVMFAGVILTIIVTEIYKAVKN